MELFELRNERINELRRFVYTNDVYSRPDTSFFDMDGKPKHWATRPKIETFIDKRKKKKRPLADISLLKPGTVILNNKAYTVLKDFLLQFGQLLEVDCDDDGEIGYFYNVTNIIPCIDFDNSERMESAIINPKFLCDAIPKDAQIFKDPYKLGINIYVSKTAKEILEKLIADAGLTGAQIVEAGAPY